MQVLPDPIVIEPFGVSLSLLLLDAEAVLLGRPGLGISEGDMPSVAAILGERELGDTGLAGGTGLGQWVHSGGQEGMPGLSRL